MTEYIDREKIERVRLEDSCYIIEHFKDDEIDCIIDAPTSDVIERSKINKAIDELRKEIEENHLNVIDYADGEWIVKDFVCGAIERFKRNIGE